MRTPVTIIAAVIGILFLPALHPDITVFSNDAPLGMMSAAMTAKPDGYGEMWNDLNWIGGAGLGPTPVSITGFLQTPLIPSISAAIIAFTAAFYRPRHFQIFRFVSIASCLAIAILAGVCAQLGLFGVISFYDHPWMFFLAPAVMGWIVTFGICVIIVESQKE